LLIDLICFFFFSSRRRHTRFDCDWSSDVCSSDLAAVGRAEGVALAHDAEERGLAMIRSMPDHHMTSMGNDLLRGNRLELPWFAGKVVELGRKHAIPTPTNDFVHAALKLYADGPPVT